MENIKVMVLNAQDLFLFMDKHNHAEIPVTELTEIKWQLMSSSLFSNKSKEKTLLLANAIKDAGADIVMVTEVGGPESLSNFAKFLLNDEYECFTLPSNSDRGIDLGFLVKKSMMYNKHLKSHVDYKLPEPARRFSRDVLRLDLLENDKPKMIFLLVHIKSKLDMSKKDFEGRSRRIHEVKGVIDIYQEIQKKYPDVPVMVGGDMNGHAGEKDTEEEFKQIYSLTDLKDIAHLAGIPDEERFSYVYFNRGGNRFEQQIDYLFISEKFKNLIIPTECYFPRYRNLTGAPLPVPKRMEQKNILPSDHYPFVATLRL
jgi:endonuclease/exonuclease/phosphatase family metal-dependent hydrolase